MTADVPDAGWRARQRLRTPPHLGDGYLTASDDPSAAEAGPKTGITVSYTAAGPDDAARVFEALATDGEVQMPMGPTSWSPAFGMCIDRFGTPWMVGANPTE
jgi:PhnB protein